MFTNTEGRPIRYDNWRRREWLPATAAASCDGAGFHDLRRLATTTMVVAGIDIKTAQGRLGHSDPRMTLAVYAAAPAEADHAAAYRLEQEFFPETVPDPFAPHTRQHGRIPSLEGPPGREPAGAGTPADLHISSSRAARI